MAPTIRKGDTIYFTDDDTYRHDDVLIVIDHRDRFYLKRYKVENGLRMLVSDNPARRRLLPFDGSRPVGRVVRVWREIEYAAND